jgi:hypothetical protein
MNSKNWLCSIVSLLVVVFQGQAQLTIQGRVTNQNNHPLPLVSVVLLRDSIPLTGTTTDAKGSYQLTHAFQSNHRYTLSLSLVGFERFSQSFIYPDTAALSHLQLVEENNTLSAVTVSARKPLITQKVDRYIVNVENSFLANGHTGLEVLQKSPGVWVKPDGSLQLRGGQAVSVMINDVVQRMTGEDLAEYLKTLRSEDIAKIEIIHNPPAEFEAAGTGGLIHIVLKKGRKDGLNGSINSQYRSQEGSPYGSGGASLDYKVKQLYLFGSGSLVYDRNTYWASNEVTYADKNSLYSATDRKNRNQRQQYRLGMGYDISLAHTLGLQTVGTGSQLFHDFYTASWYRSTAETTTGNAVSKLVRKPALTSTTLNYSWKIDSLGTQLKVIGDYTSSSRHETNQFDARYSDPGQNSTYRNQTPNHNSNYSAQADLAKSFAKQLDLTTGLKYSSLQRDNEVLREDWVNGGWVVHASSNRFLYRERLLMAYATVAKTLKRTTIKAGLRAEGTYTQGHNRTSGERFSKNYGGLFPSLYILQTLKKGNALYLNYVRRLQRPAFSELNPYRLQVDKYIVMVGNPALLPQYTHKLEAGYTLSKGQGVSLYYNQTTNTIAQLGRPLSDNTLEYQYQNFDNTIEYGASLNAPVTIVKGWTTTNSFTFYSLSYAIAGFSHQQTSVAAQSIHNFSLKKIADLYVSIDYRSAYVSANTRAAYQLYTDAGLIRKVFKNGGGRVRLFVIDPFNLLREQERTDYKGVLVNFYQKRQTRILGASFTYSFTAGKKFTQKNLEQSNAEERSRMGN